ncbi:MAG: hypothetical protein KY469_18910 [Actinobacteria bacterium]|nr:hypothetical protein [Actinomycetota bacterium]
MAETDLPEPTEEDERRALELYRLVEDNVLRATSPGDERCGNCQYYLNPGEKLSYCWHPKLRILVDADWWCQWWEQIPEG